MWAKVALTIRIRFWKDWIETKHPHREDSSENPPSSSLTLQNRTPLTKGTEESSSNSKSTLNLNFFFFIIIKSIHSSDRMRRCSDLTSRWHYPLIVLQWWHSVVFSGRMVKLLVTTIKYKKKHLHDGAQFPVRTSNIKVQYRILEPIGEKNRMSHADFKL